MGQPLLIKMQWRKPRLKYTHRHTHLCVYTLKGVDLLHCTGGRQASTKTVVQEPRDPDRGKNTLVELDIIYSLHFRRPMFSG